MQSLFQTLPTLCHYMQCDSKLQRKNKSYTIEHSQKKIEDKKKGDLMDQKDVL